MKACKVLLLFLCVILALSSYTTLKPRVQDWLRYQEQQELAGGKFYAVEAIDCEQRTVTLIATDEKGTHRIQPRTLRFLKQSGERDFFTKENSELVARGKTSASPSDTLFNIRGKLTGDTLDVIYWETIAIRPAAPIRSTKEQ